MIFDPKLINVEEQIDEITQKLRKLKLLDPNKFSTIKYLLKQLQRFIHSYSKRWPIHSSKLNELIQSNNALLNCLAAIDEQNVKELRTNFSNFKNNINKYSSQGSLYLIRHPDKSPLPTPKWLLAKSGVKQAKKFSEMIKEEILMSPKPVRLLIYTSEISRTQMFSKLIEHVNDPKKIGKINLDINSQRSHNLYLGPVGEGFINIYKRLGPYKTTLAWITKTEGMKEVINNGEINAPEKVLAGIKRFVSWGRKEISAPNYYTIIVGISHSPILDIWLFSQHNNVKKLISTAEYAKIEFNSVYYKKKWKEIE
jgi:hypothetical protein